MKIRKDKLYTLSFFLSPMLIIVVLFYLIPLVLTVYISFTGMKNWNIERYMHDFVGFYNYQRLFHMFKYDPTFKAVVLTTIVFVGITLIINVFGGLGLALATFFMSERPGNIYRLLWLLPRMSPIAVYSLVWYYFFHGSEIGTLNSILLKLGLISEPIPFGQIIPWGAWSIIIFVNGLVGVSFGMIVFTSALNQIPKEIVIAARVDGASGWQISKRILFPMMKWHFLYVLTWQFLSLLTTYPHLFLLVEWDLVNRDYGTTLALYVFNTAFGRGEQEQGLAAAAAVILSILGIIGGVITLKVLEFEKMIKKPRGEIE
ncbi:sugar ABC transporter permease [Pyrococcus furiosus DSM 3638]|uniref:Sugar ABC transporter permease n=3 Tax=Pyrococcus furiosus TaxID=2261 RepID=A0A5C0XNL0_PYRFU|nr:MULTISPECIES: sugar ABC transporter permease [Pyrococcus]AAL80242.1 putative ABC transporter permease protein [Pyrococcus furiosus DSM 3638]AFN04459.1 ABC transporter permease [Pyrococcus furiosus COM1]MDK2870398.1 inositol-phosphate transport system permease protein [Pyrococcus sp.]QEK77848.1 sugar ABC transporter permease [Pyrococcus furiosus DSM 3638]